MDATNEYRVGFGSDLHRLVQGRALVLGGVKIPAEHGALGHSDADAILHAIADALLGAVAAGDIGELFPDTDPANKGMNSARILEAALGLVSARGFTPVNVDVVVELESPRLKPHREELRASISRLMHLPLASVSVKAKTGEGLGPVGKGEAVAAQAVVLVRTA